MSGRKTAAQMARNVWRVATDGVAYRRGSCGGPNVACAGYVEVGSANV
jgi:hypothetical protein